MKSIILALGLFVCVALVHASSKIEPKLLQLGSTSKVNVMITLAAGTEKVLETFNQGTYATRDDRLNSLYAVLSAHAKISQAGVLSILGSFSGIEVTPYWISNQIFVKNASPAVIAALGALSDVASVQEEFFVKLHAVTDALPTTQAFGTKSYGVIKIQAPDVWNLGFSGQGIRVANIDTGVRGSHEALTGRFLGKYGWYDPILSTTSPSDNGGHGTHTMGTMTGTGGIGVAPNATWMACLACTTLGCSSNWLTACGQFMTCPTASVLFGLLTTKDCTKAPHIINNSWGLTGGNNFYSSVVAAWRSAGIIPVFSNGNGGPACNTTTSPGDYPNVFGVGATDTADTLGSFSSHGPASLYNSLPKPDISAPGVAVTSSYNTADNAYATIDGTSMAAPHVSGTVALLLSKNPTLTYDAIYKAITGQAVQASLNGATGNCGGKSDSVYPNNAFGYGRVNAYSAIQTV